MERKIRQINALGMETELGGVEGWGEYVTKNLNLSFATHKQTTETVN